MNMKVTIEVDGTSQEVGEWLRQLPVARDGVSPAVAAADWTPELADSLVERITDKARMALGYMAMHAPEITFSELQREMRMDGVKMGGVLASFGFAKNAGLPRPYRVDRDRRRYYIDTGVAEVILDALRRYEDEE
jgi:hypothetical protein